uniref:Uncharacterized protein n=1 Tax=Arundo donax TaxID=35708 RepID=A0A0A8ZY61_ARUDO
MGKTGNLDYLFPLLYLYMLLAIFIH